MFSGFAKFCLAAAFGSGAAVLTPPADAAPGGEAPGPAGSRATTPPLSWRGVERVAILCQVTSETIVGSDVATKTLCDRVRAVASRGAPVPIDVIDYSDPALRAPRTVILFVQASIAEVAPSRLGLILTARAEQIGAPEEARTYFGAAPRVAPFASPTDGAAWDQAIAASLSEVLPWLRPADKGDLLTDR